jgi:hypothetical protein
MDYLMLTAILVAAWGALWMLNARRRLHDLERQLHMLAVRLRRLDDELSGYIGSQTVESRTIRTRRLELIDDEGAPMARLSFSIDGPSLDLLDRTRKVRASLWVEDKGPAFILYDQEGNAVHSAP